MYILLHDIKLLKVAHMPWITSPASVASLPIPYEKFQQKKLIVTEDYKPFKVFVRSGYAEDVVRESVSRVLHLKLGIWVKYLRSDTQFDLASTDFEEGTAEEW